MTVVDVHTHYLPGGGRTDLSRHGLSFDGGAIAFGDGTRLPAHYAELIDPDEKLAEMTVRGIEAAIVSLTPHLFIYGDDHEPVAFAHWANDELATFVGADSRLTGLATVPIGHPEDAARELERALTELGLVGAQIGTSLPDGRPLDLAGLDPLWEVADASGVPIALHPYYAGPVREPEYFLPNSVGVPFDTCLAASRLMCSGLLDRWPRLRFVLPHGGGYLPYQLGRLDQGFELKPELRGALRRPSQYLDRFWFDTVVHATPALRFLAQLVGLDRLLLGSDLPYRTGVNAPVEHVVRAGLDPHRLGATAAALFSPRRAART